MSNHTETPERLLLGAEMLQQGAAIAALPEPARRTVLGGLLVRASDGADAIFEDFDASDQAAELYLAAVADMEGVDALEILQGDPFEPANRRLHSAQFDRLLITHHYRTFCERHPADRPLEPTAPLRFVGLAQGGPGTSSWHAPGRTAREVLDLVAEHEGLDLMELWDLHTGKPAAVDFVIALTIHVQALDSEDAYAHVARLVGDLDRETHEDEQVRPGIHHLHAAGVFYGPARSDVESVDSLPRLWRSGDVAEPLTAVKL